MLGIGSAGLAFTIGASLSFAALDFLRKRAARDIDPAPLLVILSLGQIPLFGLWVLVDGNYDVGAGYIGLGALAVAISVTANLLFLKALQMSPLSVTIPVLSLTPAFSALFAAWFLGETPTIVQAIGIGLVCLGVLLLNNPGGSVRNISAWKMLSHEPGIALMAAVALLWSISGPIHKHLLTQVSVPMHGLIQLTVSTSLLALWLLARRGQDRITATPACLAWAVVASAVAALADGLQFLAFEQTLVALVESVKRVIGQLSALVIGYLAFREPITKAKTGAVAVLCVGVPLILLF